MKRLIVGILIFLSVYNVNLVSVNAGCGRTYYRSSGRTYYRTYHQSYVNRIIVEPVNYHAQLILLQAQPYAFSYNQYYQAVNAVPITLAPTVVQQPVQPRTSGGGTGESPYLTKSDFSLSMNKLIASIDNNTKTMLQAFRLSSRVDDREDRSDTERETPNIPPLPDPDTEEDYTDGTGNTDFPTDFESRLGVIDSILQKSCASCHTGNTSEKNIKLYTGGSLNYENINWDRIATVMMAGKMPPPEKTSIYHPTQEEISKVLLFALEYKNENATNNNNNNTGGSNQTETPY